MTSAAACSMATSMLLLIHCCVEVGAIGKSRHNMRIKPRMYVRHSIMYEKNCILLAGTGVRKISYVACGFSPIKIHRSEYLTRINEVYVM